MKIIPAIDIIDGKCVRLTQGDYSQKKIYGEDPLTVAKIFEDSGLQFLHLVDLDGARSGKITNWKTIENVTANCGLHVDFGGGIKTGEDIRRLFDCGISQINVGSIAVKDPQKVREWILEYGNDKVILSADVKNEKIAVSGWQEDSTTTVFDLLDEYAGYGIGYVTCTDIGTDGTLKGPNLLLYRKILAAFPSLKLTASGGVGTKEDLLHLKNAGVNGAIVGKAFYERRITLEELNSI
jgi:phosphoribosylformimino-5-aminoimidazole carboxamide ribotide isomerase